MPEISSSPAASVGLRHVLEDGVAILDGRSLGASRAEFVIRDLASLLEQASKGGQFTKARRLFAPAADASAFEAFGLVFRYLRDAYGDDLNAKLENASLALRRLSSSENLSPPERQAARDFLGQMLESLNRDVSYLRQAEPTLAHIQ